MLMLIALLLAVVRLFAGGLVKPNVVTLDRPGDAQRAMAAFLGIILLALISIYRRQTNLRQ